MRYGVLVDLAQKVRDGHPIDLGMGYLNAIWQGDANAMALRAFEHVASPPRVLNVAGPEALSVRHVAEGFGQLLGKAPVFVGQERPDALLSNASEAMSVFGPPRVDVPRMMRWIADWVARGGPSLHKPTHFEERSGKF